MNKFKELPLMAQIGIFLVAAVVIGAVGEYYYPGMQDMVAANNTAKDKLEQLKKDNEQVRPYESKFKQIQVENKQLENQLVNLRTVVPDEKAADTFIKNVQEAGSQSGVEIRRFTARPPITKELYMELPFELDIDGSFANVMAFFERIGNMTRVVNISNLAMGPTGKNVKGVKKTYAYSANETVVASFVATAFYRKEGSAMAAPPAKPAAPSPAAAK